MTNSASGVWSRTRALCLPRVCWVNWVNWRHWPGQCSLFCHLIFIYTKLNILVVVPVWCDTHWWCQAGIISYYIILLTIRWYIDIFYSSYHTPGASYSTIRTVSNTLGIKSVDSIWIMELVVMLPVTTLLTWSPPLVAKAGTKARRCGWEESRLCLTGSYLRSHHYDQSARCLKPPLLILNVTPPLKLGAANFKL